jgi:hypothetical protein
MAARPKGVQFALDDNITISDISAGDTTTDSAQGAQGTLQYINAQLLAHGFIYGSVLSLDGLGRDDEARVAKCLLGMLSARVVSASGGVCVTETQLKRDVQEDMARTEDLSTKLRTLSYDYERLDSRYKDVSERAATAERETHVFKSRLA